MQVGLSSPGQPQWPSSKGPLQFSLWHHQDPGSSQGLPPSLHSGLDRLLQHGPTSPSRRAHQQLTAPPDTYVGSWGSTVQHQWCLSAKESGRLLSGKLPQGPGP